MAISIRQIDYIGKQIGNLRLTKKIGHGGFGSVYMAEHTRLGTYFAVKLLHVQLHNEPSLLARFEREAQTIARLSHPHIVRISDFGQLEDGVHYFVMDFYRGAPLNEILAHKESLPASRLSAWIEQLCSALQLIHRKNIIHRDLKPPNIFLADDPDQPEPQVKLLDFGIVGLSQEETMTGTGVTMGSARYMSPEQASGNSKDADATSDLYSLGIIVYEMLVGEVPFSGAFTDVIIRHVTKMPLALGTIRPQIIWAPELDAFLQKALAKKSAERYEDADVFFQAFQAGMEAQQKLTPEQLFPLNYPENEVMELDTIPLDELLSFQSRALGSSDEIPSGDSFQLVASSEAVTYPPSIPTRSGKSLKPRYLLVAFLLLASLSGVFLLWQQLSERRLLSSSRSGGTLQITPKKGLPQKRRIVPAFGQSGTVQLILNTAPTIAEVWVGARRVGQTPYVLSGQPGQTYALSLRLFGYKTVDVKGTLTRHARQTRHMVLQAEAQQAKSMHQPKKRKRPFEIEFKMP